MCGHAIEVPDSMLNSVRRLSDAMPDGPTLLSYAARILRPGAITSSLKIYADFEFGLWTENEAATGVDGILSQVPR